MITKSPAPVTPDQTVSDALQTILRHNFNYLLEYEQATRARDNIKGVHQSRVSFRRMRSALSVFQSAVPRTISKTWADELRYHASQLGMARDLDVFIDEGLGAVRGKLPLNGEEKLATLAHRLRKSANKDVIAMLDSNRYANFKKQYSAWVEGKQWEQADLSNDNKDILSSNIVAFSRNLLNKLNNRFLEKARLVDRKSAKKMHRLRIKGKKLRYTAEFFSPLFDGQEDFIFHLKKLQSLLGTMNDVSVMQDLLDHLLEDENDHEVCEYAGGIVGWRTREYFELLDTFDDHLEKLANTNPPWRNKEK